jgi:hypothetical protein
MLARATTADDNSVERQQLGVTGQSAVGEKMYAADVVSGVCARGDRTASSPAEADGCPSLIPDSCNRKRGAAGR